MLLPVTALLCWTRTGVMAPVPAAAAWLPASGSSPRLQWARPGCLWLDIGRLGSWVEEACVHLPLRSHPAGALACVRTAVTVTVGKRGVTQWHSGCSANCLGRAPLAEKMAQSRQGGESPATCPPCPMSPLSLSPVTCPHVSSPSPASPETSAPAQAETCPRRWPKRMLAEGAADSSAHAAGAGGKTPLARQGEADQRPALTPPRGGCQERRPRVWGPP